jgi:hypothetical protein
MMISRVTGRHASGFLRMKSPTASVRSATHGPPYKRLPICSNGDQSISAISAPSSRSAVTTLVKRNEAP